LATEEAVEAADVAAEEIRGPGGSEEIAAAAAAAAERETGNAETGDPAESTGCRKQVARSNPGGQ